MKKQINAALWYAIAAMACGVFYREFTKFNGFTGKTTLSVVHTHFFVLGMLVMLAAALFADKVDFTTKKAVWFWRLYHIGVPLTGAMLLVRGVPQVLGITLSKAMDASISGIAGIAHVLTGTGLILFLLVLKEAAKKQPQLVKNE